MSGILIRWKRLHEDAGASGGASETAATRRAARSEPNAEAHPAASASGATSSSTAIWHAGTLGFFPYCLVFADHLCGTSLSGGHARGSCINGNTSSTQNKASHI